MHCFTQALPKVAINNKAPNKSKRPVQPKLILAKAPPNPHSNQDISFWKIILGIGVVIFLASIIF